mmetsp:Transcript_23854/g.36065  ORF Transcript_23854/g.36065 Transcript_23854/m.36065 type:complete len:294 (-) Transcript_23854:54-935(-)
MGLVLLGIVLSQDFQGKLDSLQALRKVSLVLGKSFLLLSTNLVHLCLRRCEVGEGLLERSNFLLQLSRSGSHFVDAGRQLLDLACLVGLLFVRLRQLLVAIGFLGGILLSLLLEASDEVHDQALHLGEGVGTRGGAGVHDAAHAGGQLSQSAGVLLAGQVLHETHDFELNQAGRGSNGGSTALCGDLHEGIAHISSSASGISEDFLGTGESLQLLCSTFRFSLVVLGLGHALLLQSSESLLVDIEGLRGHSEVALGLGLLLAGGGQGGLGLGQLLLRKLDLVLQALLHQLEGL